MSQKNEFENLEDKKIKHSYIQNMFSDISHTYDLMNNIFTFGQHKKWRKKIVKQEITQNDSVLDIGCGTGDFVFDCLPYSKNSIVGIDFAKSMVEIAYNKSDKFSQKTNFLIGDALILPIQSNRFDVCSMSFVLRNISDVDVLLREVHRILKPGGKIIIIDAFKKTNRFRIINFFSKLYSTFLVPIIGRWVSGHSNAYQYLNYSIEKFFTLDELSSFIERKHFIVKNKQTFLFGSVGVLVVQKSN